MCCKPPSVPRAEYGVAVPKRRGRACGIYVGSVHPPPTDFRPRPTHPRRARAVCTWAWSRFARPCCHSEVGAGSIHPVLDGAG
jgi:hypothetical protein